MTPLIGQSGSLARDFGAPPFSVLNGKDQSWQSDKRRWINLGLKSDTGRDVKVYSFEGKKGIMGSKSSDTSVFDPKLCEVIYKWFSDEGDQIIDPFAGGSVRGIVAGCTKRKYLGIDIRLEQIEANIKNLEEVSKNTHIEHNPIWKCMDSMELGKAENIPEADMIMSCPPYFDLEVYGDNAGDISNMGYEGFKQAYLKIILQACQRLKGNKFAVFVIGNIRDKEGALRDLVGLTVESFQKAGLKYYNDIIFETPIGTAALRGRKQFSARRKVVMVHQHVLVFYKGNIDQIQSLEGGTEISTQETLF